MQRHYDSQHPQISEEIAKGDIAPYLMEKEIPPFPIHSNWKDMIYGAYEIDGLNDTEWSLTINRFKPGTITML